MINEMITSIVEELGGETTLGRPVHSGEDSSLHRRSFDLSVPDVTETARQ